MCGSGRGTEERNSFDGRRQENEEAAPSQHGVASVVPGNTPPAAMTHDVSQAGLFHRSAESMDRLLEALVGELPVERFHLRTVRMLPELPGSRECFVRGDTSIVREPDCPQDDPGQAVDDGEIRGLKVGVEKTVRRVERFPTGIGGIEFNHKLLRDLKLLSDFAVFGLDGKSHELLRMKPGLVPPWRPALSRDREKPQLRTSQTTMRPALRQDVV
jgi:hypothetical protein